MAKGPEAKLKDEVEAWCREHGLKVVRLALMPGVKAGWPDTIILGPAGVAVWVELKAPGKKPSRRQLERISDLHKLGHHATWSDSFGAIYVYLMNVFPCLQES